MEINHNKYYTQKYIDNKEIEYGYNHQDENPTKCAFYLRFILDKIIMNS